MATCLLPARAAHLLGRDVRYTLPPLMRMHMKLCGAILHACLPRSTLAAVMPLARQGPMSALRMAVARTQRV